MSDVFISYASEDRPKAKALADMLMQRGWSVWWDRVIPVGSSWDEVIEEQLDSAKCVVVLWSSSSTRSDWVKVEAREGLRRRILLPALLEDVKLPLEFRHLQAANLIDWSGESGHHQLGLLVQAIESLVRPAAKGELTAPIGDKSRESPPMLMPTTADNTVSQAIDTSSLTQFQRQILEVIDYARDNFRAIRGKRLMMNSFLASLSLPIIPVYESAFALTGSKRNTIVEYNDRSLAFISEFKFSDESSTNDFLYVIAHEEVMKITKVSYERLKAGYNYNTIYQDVVIRIFRNYATEILIAIIKYPGKQIADNADPKSHQP